MSLTDNLFQALADVAGVSLVILAIGAVVTWRLRQPIERVRSIQWTLAALVAALVIRQASLLPPLSIALLPETSSVAPESDQVARAHSTDSHAVAGDAPHETAYLPAESRPVAVTGQQASPTEDGAVVASAPAGRDSASLAGSLWGTLRIACVAVAALVGSWLIALLFVGRWQLQRLLRTSEGVTDEVLVAWDQWPEARRRGTRVLFSSRTSVPMTFGVWRPVIVLPNKLAEPGSRRQLVYCLSHEWEHVRRRDIVTWWLVHLLEPLLWFQPLFWYLRRELRTCQDQVADNSAVQGTDNRTDYAELLMELVCGRRQRGNRLALTMADRRWSLYRRVELLLSDRFRLADSARRRVSAGLAGAMVVLAIGLGVLRLEPAMASPGDGQGGSPTTNETAEEDKQQATDSLSFSGTVIDKRTKEPIKDAKVVVRRMILKSDQRKIIEESEHQTDTDGNYSFVIPPEQVAERYLYIELDVEHPDYAWKKGFGYALGMIRKNLRLGDPPFFSKIELTPGETLSGRVVGPDGKPVAGVKMLAYSRDAEDRNDYGSFFRAKTDQQGRFTLSLAKGGPSLFWIVPKDFAPQQFLSGTKRGDWGDIQLEKGVSISGRVVNAAGEAVAGVWVNLSDEASRNEIKMPVASAMNRSARADENGKFQLGPMKPGKFKINVGDYPREITYHKPGRNPNAVHDVFIAQEIEILPQETQPPITIQAVPHVQFVGQYLDSKGETCRGHSVSVWGEMNGQWFHTRLPPDSEGKIVGRLPKGLERARLNAITNEHGSLRVRLKKEGPLLNPRDLDLGVIEDDITGLEVIRYIASVVQIKAVDEKGQQITEFKIAGVYEGDDELMHPVATGLPTHIFFEKQTDGRYRTSQMLPNKKTTFTIKADGYQDASETISLPEGEEKEITLVMKKKSEDETQGDAPENGGP